MLLDSNFDIYAAEMAEVPEFKEWRDEWKEEVVVAEDETTEYKLWQEVLRMAETPAEGSGCWQATVCAVQIIKEQAVKALEVMHDPRRALADKLTSQNGINAFARNQDAHKRTHGIDGSNDRTESKFAVADVHMRRSRHISIHNVAGIIQQRTQHDFDRSVTIVNDRRKRKSDAEQEKKLGFFWTLRAELRESLGLVARRDLPEALKQDRADRRAHDAEKLKRREEAVQRQLQSAADKFAESLELFDQWQAQGSVCHRRSIVVDNI